MMLVPEGRWNTRPPHLPPGIKASTYDRLHAAGFDRETTLWLCDFDTLTHTVLRENDGAVR